MNKDRIDNLFPFRKKMTNNERYDYEEMVDKVDDEEPLSPEDLERLEQLENKFGISS